MSTPGPIPRVKPTRQQVVSLQDQAIIDAGRSLFTSSVTVGRDSAKAMAPACTGAIAAYFAVLKLVAPNKVHFSVWDGLAVALPVVTFSLASACFIIAFTPRLRRVSLNAIDDLTIALDAMVVRQYRWNRNGLWLFTAATAAAGIGLALAMLRWHK